MSADMKMLREALQTLGDATDNGAGGGAANYRAAEALDEALNELESLRGQAAYVASLDTENQRLRAEKAEAQRDELLAALVEATAYIERHWPNGKVSTTLRAAIARGGK